MTWLFVDDSKQEREAFARALSRGWADNSVYDAISGSTARKRLGKGELVADGILMDVSTCRTRTRTLVLA